MRRKEREELGDEAPPKLEPRTLENTREEDVTVPEPEDEEIQVEEAGDEMATYFGKEKEPRVVITTSELPSSVGLAPACLISTTVLQTLCSHFVYVDRPVVSKLWRPLFGL